nr:hypothetical protein GCM10020093_061390 [Planobispora longispora]
MRLTVAQALVRFLAAQWSERDGVEQRLVAGVFGIFGHGNVAGLGQALAERGAGTGDALPYYLARNEQAMVHTAVGYARTRERLSTFACTTSIGPGATNMVTGAALATINRVPVLLLPGDVFATRVAGPVLQELEDPRSYDVTVNDALRPVSRFFDRINRPEQLPAALLAAMRVLTDPAETGAVTLALPQDVQAEAYDWPEELFARRVWHVARPAPEPAALARALELIRGSRRPLIVAGEGSPTAGRARRWPPSPGGAGRRWRRRRRARAPCRTTTPLGRRGRPHRHRRGQRAGAGGGPGDRRRDPLQRLHHRLPDAVRAGPVPQRQRRRLRRGQELRGDARRRRPRGAGGVRGAGGLAGRGGWTGRAAELARGWHEQVSLVTTGRS